MLEDAGRIAAARHQFPKYTRTSAPEGAKTPMFSIDEAREHEREGPCDAGRGSKAFYSWNSAMAAKGSQNTKITTNGQRWALLTATYSRMNAVGQK